MYLFSGVMMIRDQFTHLPYAVSEEIARQICKDHDVQLKYSDMPLLALAPKLCKQIKDILPPVPDNQPVRELILFTDTQWHEFFVTLGERLVPKLAEGYIFICRETGEVVEDRFVNWVMHRVMDTKIYLQDRSKDKPGDRPW